MHFAKRKMVYIEWEDASSNNGYYDKKDPPKTVMCRTIGFLAEHNKGRVVLTSELFVDGDARHIHTIPRKMVKRIVQLEEREIAGHK